MSPPVDRKNSARFRLAAVGFNARVEPFAYSLERMRKDMGLFEYWGLKKESDRRLAAIREGLKKQKADDRAWLKAKGACLCNLRVARMGILADLREHAKSRPDGLKRFPHVIRMREFNAAAVPVPFDRPFTVPPAPGGKDPLVVVSAPRMAAELAELETALRTEQTFRMKMVDFLDVTSAELAKFDAKVGEVDEFWTKFGYVLLKRLVDKSGESGFPILVA